MPFYDSLAKINSNRRARPILVITYTSIFSKNFCDFLPDTNNFPNKKQIEQIEVSAKNLSYNIWFYSDGTLHSEDIWTKYNSDSIESLGPSIGYDYKGNISGYAHASIDKSIMYHPNGKVRDIIRYDTLGQREGIAEYYTEEGVLDKRLLFRKDTLNKVLLDNKLFPNPPLDMWMLLDSIRRVEYRNKSSE